MFLVFQDCITMCTAYEHAIQNHLVYQYFNPLNAELNPVCHLMSLLGAHHILNVSRIRVNPYLNVDFKRCLGKASP